jgi:hypothetical protein
MTTDQSQPRALWFKETGDALAHAVWGTAEWLDENNTSRNTRYLRHARLYANTAITALKHGGIDSTTSSPQEDPRLNVSRNMVDAVTAKIAKNRPKPTVITEGGDFGLQQQARRLDQFVWGLFYKNHVHAKTGILKVFSEVHGPEDARVGNIKVERVMPWELYVDPLDGFHGSPRSIFRTKLIDRQQLRAMFDDPDDPKRAKKLAMIDRAQKSRLNAEKHATDAFADQILVIEGHHLRSGPDASDALHAIIIKEGVLLEDHEWHGKRFPYSCFRWAHPLAGFWGDSLVGEVEGLQLELNELMFKIQQAMWHQATPKCLVPVGGKIQDSEIDNDVRGCIVHYSGGEKPTWETHPSVHPEVFAHLDRIYARSFEIAGISQLSAQSQKPAGLDSGRSLLVFNDIESERFAPRGQDFEASFLELATLMIDEARALAEMGIDVEVVAEDRRRRRSFLRRIKWSEVDLEEDSFVMKIFPASSLPQSPAGRIAAVEALVSAQLIPQEDALSLLDFPDLKSVMDRNLAPYELVLDQVEIMIEDGEYVPPSPFQDLALSRRIVQLTLLRAQMEKVPEKRLDLLRDHINAADKLLREAEAAAQAGAQAGIPPTAPGPAGGEPALVAAPDAGTVGAPEAA